MVAAATAAAMLSATSPVVSAQGGQQQAEAPDKVEPNSPLGFMAVLPRGEIVQIYPCVRNRGDAITNHGYLYLPPLTLERDSDGRVVASETPSGGVRVRMKGRSPVITSAVQAWLANEARLNPTRGPGSASVEMLGYDQILILDADREEDARWQAVDPDPVCQSPSA